LVRDFEAGETRTLIKHEGVPIFSEPARSEGYRRFEEVAQILKASTVTASSTLCRLKGANSICTATMGKATVSPIRYELAFSELPPRQEKGRGKDSRRVLSYKHTALPRQYLSSMLC
jgi:hypothetical protein